MVNETERNEGILERNQDLMLIGLAVGAVGFVGQEIADLAGAADAIGLGAALLTLAGMLTFAYALVRNSKFNDSEMLTGVIDDERSRFVRYASYSIGFAAVIALQVAVAVGVPILGKLGLTAPTAPFFAALTIFVGLITALVSYRRLDR
jgi:cytosine/uracil/thiamine/allantoin permease